ncbi:MAG: VWA domain-containing protein, partial [Phycisphaerae bacterium]
MIATYGFHFEQPWWLVVALIVLPIVYLAWRSLQTLGVVRRVMAVALRVAVVLLLAAVLGRPTVTRTHDRLTLLAVIDRSRSIPPEYWEKPEDPNSPRFLTVNEYLTRALAGKPTGDQLAVIDVAEAADITRLPSTAVDVPKRTVHLTGDQSRLAAGVQMALAVAPPDTCVRIILISDGNETAGDLKAVARVAAANRIPVDVLPLPYNYRREVVFRRLVAPGRARSGQTVPLRFVLTSTHEASGRLLLMLNQGGRHTQPVDLDPDSDGVTVPIRLKTGTNVHTISLPMGAQGVHEFEATFVPAGKGADTLAENNQASAVTFVAGKGHVLLVSADPREAARLAEALTEAKMDVRPLPAGEFPTRLTALLDADAVVLVNTPNHLFSVAQQEMICRYVADLGGGLLTVGGPSFYGAGGWIGSPVEKILPVDMDPPQKKQMPKGALVLIMHACEMPRGNFWGKKVAIAAVRALSRHDLVGVIDFSWNAGMRNWVYPLQKAGDKKDCIAAISQMVMGDMPNFGPPVEAAYQALKDARAGQKHIIIISDGDPTRPTPQQIANLRKEQITATGVAVFPHSPQQVMSLQWIAANTGGRFYNVKDPAKLPQIFIKEAQVVRRSLIIEDTFVPRIVGGMNEILRGLRDVRALDGRVLTGPKRGLNEILLATSEGEPILATTQAGLGRVASFTSSADSRWASKWLTWSEFNRLWEQTIRWVAKSPQATDCEAFADVQGRSVTLTVEASQPDGSFLQFADLTGQVIAPDAETTWPLELRQIGPGQYRASFQAEAGGSYLVNLRYRKAGADEKFAMVQTVVNVPFAPEFEDLTDNAALLHELAETSGGRVLPPSPEKADLFSRAGLTPPRASMPLTRPLLIAWVIIFLLDVAVRRIAVDFKAIARRVAAVLKRQKADLQSATLAALKSRRQRVQKRLGGRKDPD